MPEKSFGYTSTISHFGERFHDGKCSFVCCFSIHDAPRAQPFVKWGMGARAAHALWSRRQWLVSLLCLVVEVY